MLAVKFIDNIRISVFSESEILAQTKGDNYHCCMLETYVSTILKIILREKGRDTYDVKLFNYFL